MRTDRNDFESIARRQLSEEFDAAFAESPEATVRTPEGQVTRTTVAAIIASDLSDDSPDLFDLLRIVSHGERGADVSIACKTWKERVRDRYAAQQAIDVAGELANEASSEWSRA